MESKSNSAPQKHEEDTLQEQMARLSLDKTEERTGEDETHADDEQSTHQEVFEE